MRFTASEFNVFQIEGAWGVVFPLLLLLITMCGQMNGPATITVVICNTAPWMFLGKTWEDKVKAKVRKGGSLAVENSHRTALSMRPLSKKMK